MTPEDIGLAYEEVKLSTEDGTVLHGWFVPAGRARQALLFCHGNAGNISHRLESIALFHRLGLTVLIFDYRGYGRSEGKSTEHGTYLDVAAAWRYLTQTKGFAPQQVVVFGRSLGGAVAAWLASRYQPAALIVESTFSSIPELARDLYPLLPTRWLTRFEYGTRAYAQKVVSPVLVVHSRDDEIIPFDHGQRIFESIAAPKQFLELRGGHNDGFLVSNKAYEDGLRAFLEKQLRAPM